MLKIAVVEDQQEVRDELCRFIRQYAAENSLQVEVLPIEDGAVIAEHYEPGYDIIFMDVEMPGLDGFGAAEKIRAVDADAVLVFVTNMAQYAIKGYEVDALDYVLKPVNYYQFCTKLSRAVQRVQRRRGGQVVLQLAGGGMQVLSTGDIYYLVFRPCQPRQRRKAAGAVPFLPLQPVLSGQPEICKGCGERLCPRQHRPPGDQPPPACGFPDGGGVLHRRCAVNLLARHVIFRALLRWTAAVAFCIPLKHRPHARLRALGMLLPLLGLTYVLDPAAQSTSLHELQFSLLTLYVAFFVLLGMMIYACVEIDKKSALYCAVWSLLASQAAYECWHLVEVFFEWRGTPLDLGSLPVMLAQLAAGAFFYFVICTTLSRKMSYKGMYNIGPRQLTSAFFIGILFMFQAALLSSGQVVALDRSLVMTMFVGQFYFLTLLYFQTEVFKLSAVQKEMDTLNLLYERQREQYQVARQNVQIINKRCHELKLQIAALRQMSSAPADPELKAHIDEAEKAAQLYDASRNTGNEVLDVVLTEKSLLCESRRIQLNAVTDGSCLSFFEASDLYALFANMLDHAIESAVKVPEPERRCIDLLVCTRQSFVVVNVISPDRPAESADTRAAHYAVKVTNRIVQKYKGTLTTESQNGFFAVKIIFPSALSVKA